MGSSGSSRQKALKQEEEDLQRRKDGKTTPSQLKKKIFIEATPIVTEDEKLQMMVKKDLFEPLREDLMIGSDLQQHAVVSFISYEVIENNTGCDVVVKLENLFDQQTSSWLEGDYSFSEEKAPDPSDRSGEDGKYTSIQKSSRDDESASVVFSNVFTEETQLDPELTEENKKRDSGSEKSAEQSED